MNLEAPETSTYQDKEGVKFEYEDDTPKASTSIVSSSIPKLDMKNISRYLKDTDESKNRDYFDKFEYDDMREENEEHRSIMIFNRKKTSNPSHPSDTSLPKNIALAETKEHTSQKQEPNTSDSESEYEYVEKTCDSDEETKSKKKKSHKKKKHHKKSKK